MPIRGRRLQRRRPDRGNWLFRRKGKLGFLVLALLAGLAWMPMRQSVLAPAEVIPKQPVLVRAPIDGVIDRFEVLPNQLVTEGQVLLTPRPRASPEPPGCRPQGV